MEIKVKVINFKKDEFGVSEFAYSKYEEEKKSYYYNKLKSLEKELKGYTIIVEIDEPSAKTTFSIEPDLNNHSLRMKVLKVLVPEQLN
ncbi:hypothetical protein [Elizabethkingia anophelis]|uniref:hypothetical protein n=1 Tax=Elizabethkingia anophelis TaxID=1117645 RepID=UPI0021A60281|nr:hypothetical protein [Elizabethkingia anophelis]MCT3817781.1 hypothetical protein [Elizabethkingia anophelis]MCT3875020.1 hypothetical protein [Elizabethkingia anophelis]MDV3536795.1 hypothetical protein [Elizabethkingia anophelis]MDV4070258.1 hypothetical protein [Elizabethkingia anophelis]